MTLLTADREAAAGRDSRDRGDAIVVWCLLLAIMLLPLGGLSVDLWRGIAVQRQLQSAAEDAALAGSSGLDLPQYRRTGCVALDPGIAVALAQANLESQSGIGLASSNIEVSANGEQISVSLREDVRLTLLAAVEGNRRLVVRATASSRPRGSLSGSGCAAIAPGPAQ